MREVPTDREGQPNPMDLFPMSRQSVSDALEVLANRMLSEEGVERGSLMANNNLGTLKLTNFQAFDYIDEKYIDISGDENFSQSWLSGATIAWLALQELAESREIKIPKLTHDFVEDYRAREEGKGEEELQMQKAETFKAKSPQASSYIIDRIRQRYGDSNPEQNPIYLGFAELHALFVKGCKDPRNL